MLSTDPAVSIPDFSSSNRNPEQYELSRYLPPYRSLLNPNRTFDYRSHKYVEGSVEFKFSSLFARKKKPESNIKMKYRSLLTPLSNTRKRIMDAASDTLSVKSLRSSLSVASLRKSPNLSAQHLMDLPDEILTAIVSYLRDDQKSLVHLLYVNKRLNMSVKPVLYENPYVSSTYRLAQLVHTINNSKELALMVKTIDLSTINPGLELEEYAFRLYDIFAEQGDNTMPIASSSKDILAGWRDWRYRNHPLYGLQRTLTGQAHRSSRSSRPEMKDRKMSASSNSTTGSLFSNNDDSETDSSRTLSASPIRTKRKKQTFRNSLKQVFKSTSSATVTNFDISDMYSDLKLTKSTTPKFPPKVSDLDFLTQPDPLVVGESTQPYSTPHPLQNRFLSQYCYSKDIPIGYLLHIFQECENLVHVDLTGVSCSNDFEMKDYEYFNWQTSKGKIRQLPVIGYRSLLLDTEEDERKRKEESAMLSRFKTEKPIFWSDTQREIDWENTDCVQLEFDDIWKQLNKLKNLRTIKLRSICWLEKSVIRKMVTDSQSITHLEYIDCTDSGMRKSLEWAKRRTVKQWKRFFRYEDAPRAPQVASRGYSFENIGHEYY
ncbi:hypothetical protein KL947_004666 [Ogataea haglerorum]|nr:hypothetical protein KL947_004666 [Ogataea haglerorum]